MILGVRLYFCSVFLYGITVFLTFRNTASQLSNITNSEPPTKDNIFDRTGKKLRTSSRPSQILNSKVVNVTWLVCEHSNNSLLWLLTGRESNYSEAAVKDFETQKQNTKCRLIHLWFCCCKAKILKSGFLAANYEWPFALLRCDERASNVCSCSGNDCLLERILESKTESAGSHDENTIHSENKRYFSM
jgi:hypothetical protein